MVKRNTFLALLAALVIIACNAPETKTEEVTQEAGEVNVYSHRYYDVDREIFDDFTEKTGITVNVKEDKADKLIALLQSEGEHSQADLFITSDAGRLHFAKELGLLQAINSEVLKERIPLHLRDTDDQWYGLTKRARVLMYNKEMLSEEELPSYEELGNEEWKGQIFVRSSSNIYNQSLLAAMISHHGEEYATNWATSVVENMAREPKGNDRDQIREVAAGNGKIAIANTYYLGKLINSDNEMERQAMDVIGIHFARFEGGGSHINISGAGVTAYSPNRANAIALLEYLTSEEVQQRFAESNYEYPANPAVEPAELLRSWGDVPEDSLNLGVLGELNAKAVEIFEASGWK